MKRKEMTRMLTTWFDEEYLTKKMLAGLLSSWFDAQPKRCRLDNDPIWKVIKTRLLKLGRWRNLPGGDPKKGYLNQQVSLGRAPGSEVINRKIAEAL